ncbi:hypothetical protein H6G52_09045 [Limnothrix sp. FACHB-881]|uniref:DUF3024 domain-containing protein n=1 Tax=Limnothrix sp. FACHB-881 TaxID=2692819 RepID=UPI001688E962|nr:hypothetical protein [Limnothrix sp. FACHB-881]MBD2635502.1 hypothetical protein [Limnothrix sp. FACHB-881]
MPKSRKYQWVYSPSKQNKPKVPEAEKQAITQQVQALIDTDLAPRYLHQDQHAYFQIESLFTKWHRSFIYLCYTCRLKNSEAVEAAIAEFKDSVIREAIEERFTRLEYVAPDQFNLAYFRHTGKWWTTHENITLDAALTTIREYEIYHP